MTNATASESSRAIAEVAAALDSIPPADLDRAAAVIAESGVVACYAGGREGVALRGLTMRLFHAGVDAHTVGDMSCPAVREGDLLVVSCGPGRISTVAALISQAKAAGARVLYFTAQPTITPVEQADDVIVIEAQTMANDAGSEAVLPMGSSYEIALFLVGDLLTNRVRAIRGETAETMRHRHTNLE